jgi:hypothetical protein
MDVQQGEFETMIFIKNTNWQQEIRRHQLRWQPVSGLPSPNQRDVSRCVATSGGNARFPFSNLGEENRNRSRRYTDRAGWSIVRDSLARLASWELSAWYNIGVVGWFKPAWLPTLAYSRWSHRQPLTVRLTPRQDNTGGPRKGLPSFRLISLSNTFWARPFSKCMRGLHARNRSSPESRPLLKALFLFFLLSWLQPTTKSNLQCKRTLLSLPILLFYINGFVHQ